MQQKHNRSDDDDSGIQSPKKQKIDEINEANEPIANKSEILCSKNGNETIETHKIEMNAEEIASDEEFYGFDDANTKAIDNYNENNVSNQNPLDSKMEDEQTSKIENETLNDVLSDTSEFSKDDVKVIKYSFFKIKTF